MESFISLISVLLIMIGGFVWLGIMLCNLKGHLDSSMVRTVLTRNRTQAARQRVVVKELNPSQMLSVKKCLR